MTEEIKCPVTGQKISATVIGNRKFCNDLLKCPHQCPLCPNSISGSKEEIFAAA